MTDAAPTSPMRRDIASAYLVTFSRVASWAIVSALVYRRAGPDAFAAMVFVRATIGLLNYVSVGLGPAMIRMLAEAKAIGRPSLNRTSSDLDYFTGEPIDPANKIYANGILWSIVMASTGFGLVIAYAVVFGRREFAKYTVDAVTFATLFGFGVVVRLASDAASAVLQTSGRIVLDNVILAVADWLWVALCAVWLTVQWHNWSRIGGAFLISSFALAIARYAAAERIVSLRRFPWWQHADFGIQKRLLSIGLLVTLAQVADFLYAPTDYVLIATLLQPNSIAIYAPAIQIDAALLLLVSGIAAVTLPRSALAHTRGEMKTLQRYYVRGTIISLSLLVGFALVVALGASKIFRVWLGDPMRSTQAILPLVLIHTVIGGSSAVGRSILLGMGKVKPFTISVLIAGASNVILSFCFVRFFHLGLRGIIYGTIVAVVGRCAIWMPWYVLRTLKRERVVPVDLT